MKLHRVAGLGFAFAVAGATGCSADATRPDGTETTAQANTKLPPEGHGTPAVVVANAFQLDGGDFHVSYAPTAIGKGSVFVYQDAQQTLSFHDDDVHVASTEAGTLVTVVLFQSVDSGSTTFSVLVPRVQVGASTTAAVQTHAITTVHKFSVVESASPGQLDDFTLTPLHGTATHVGGLSNVTSAVGRL